MRILVSSIAAALLAACSSPQIVELKVVSFNLRHDVDFWEDRFQLIAGEIARLEPDLIGFQEVEIAAEQTRVLQNLIAERNPELLYDYHEQLKTSLAAVSGEGIAIFSRYPIVARQMVDLSYGRPAIFDRIRVSNELTIDFYDTHLHNEGGDEVRKPQMEALLTFMAQNDNGYVTLLTGDMNARPDSATYRTAVESGLIDTFAEVHGADTERVGNTSPIVLAKMPVTQRPNQRIDYIFLETPPEGASVMVKSSSIAFDRPDATGLYPSDHLGLITRISIDVSTLD